MLLSLLSGALQNSLTAGWCHCNYTYKDFAVHWCWVTPHLYEEQICKGVIAMTPTCCEPVLHSSTEQRGMRFANNSVALVLGHCTPV